MLMCKHVKESEDDESKGRYVVLLTGGLASGKDTVSSYLSALGATLLDLDTIAKEAQTEEPVLTQLMDAFGGDIVGVDGLLDRALLAQRAFADRQSADMLNAICWPPVKERVANYLLTNSCQPMRQGKLLVVQVPLLVEAPDFLDLADEVISVAVDENIRLRRAVARGMDITDARNRLALQASDEERAAISNTIFTNNGTLNELETQVRQWYADRIENRLF
jgi:dephospho-CoA kinase